MSKPFLRILLVEDSSSDARLLLHELREAGFETDAVRVECESDYIANLDPPPDVVLCDYNLPQFDALRALELLRAREFDVPFIVVSGAIGEETAVQAMRHGATDYLLKDRLGRLAPAVKQALEQQKLREAERRTREELRAAAVQYRALAESIPQLVWTARADGALDYVNQRMREYTGLASADLLDWGWTSTLHPDEKAETIERWKRVAATQKPAELEFRLRRWDGEARWHIMRQVAIRDEAGGLVRWFGTCTDVHDQKTVAFQLARDALLLANVRDSVIVTNTEGLVTYWNEGAHQLFGWSAEEVLGRPYIERLPADAQGPLAKELTKRSDGDEWYGEYEDYRKDGSRVWIHARVGPFTDASGAPAGVLGVAYDISDRKRAEAALELRERAIQAVSQGIIITDATHPDYSIVYASSGFERLTGYPAEEVIGRSCRLLQGKDTDPGTVAQIRDAVRHGRKCDVEILNYRKDGSTFWNALTIVPLSDGGKITHYVGVQTDVSERRKLEAQFRQAHKMDAFGQLAGGVAHDFNNLLTVINGEAEMLLAELPPAGDARDSVVAIREAGERAAGFTAQLLAFSRKTIVEPKLLDLNEVVDQIGRMLRRLLGEDISLVTSLAPGVRRVKVDPGQLEQVIMNLAVNARDAMPTGGRLTIATEELEVLDGDVKAPPDCRPGSYARLSVTDTGCGMTEAVKAKVFEPFFTTKEVGKGTGLGLATAYGITKTWGGHISLVSEVDRGTTVSVLLPTAPEALVRALAPGAAMPAARGAETVLLVEDEGAVRRLARVVLERQGYVVLEAGCGTDAIKAAHDHDGPIHLVVTDVVMPGIGGRDVADKIRVRHPEARVLYMSGYTDDAVVRHGVSGTSGAFLQKPFTRTSLARKVRDVLDGTLG